MAVVISSPFNTPGKISMSREKMIFRPQRGCCERCGGKKLKT